MKLNFDLLRLVMQCLGRPELLHIMHTCHTLYELGVPLILRNVNYADFDHRCNNLYRHFLLPDPSRFVHVTRLDCYDLGIPTSLLRDFLRLSTCIVDLRIHVSHESSVTLDDVGRIGRMSHLRHLRLLGPIPVLELFRSLTVPLVSLAICQHSIPNLIPEDNCVLRNPISSINRFSGTLEEFCFNLHSSTHLHVVFTTGYSFHSMRKFEWSTWHPIDIGAIVSTFPNLDSLSVRFYGVEDHSHHFRDSPLLSAEQMAVFRQRSQETQQWDVYHCLRYLQGSVPSLWTLGIQCQVELLDISVIHREIPLTHTRDLLASTRPPDLCLSFPSYGYRRGVLANLPGFIFAYETVQKLELKLSVTQYEIKMAADELVRSIRSTQLLC